MLKILSSQVAEILREQRLSRREELIDRFRGEYPQLAATAIDIIDGALDEAEELGFEDVEHIYRLAELARLPGFPHVPGAWAEWLLPALSNPRATPEARLTFVERELVPRILAENEHEDAHV